MGRSPFWKSRKKAIWRHLWSIQNEAISLVAVHWQRILIALGKSRHCQNWLECRSRGMKTYSEARIELWNLQFLKRMLEKSSQFLSLDQPNEPKSLDVTWVLQELKNTLGKLAIAVNLEAIRFEFWTERIVRDGGNLCSLWSVILKSVWNSVGDTFQLRYSWLWAVVSCILLAAVPWNVLEHSHRKARLCVYFIRF